jgi:cell division protein FtsB
LLIEEKRIKKKKHKKEHSNNKGINNQFLFILLWAVSRAFWAAIKMWSTWKVSNVVALAGDCGVETVPIQLAMWS